MSVSLFVGSAEEEEFRADVIRFISEYRGLNGFHFQGSKWPEVKALYRAIGQCGWMSIGWSDAAGGLGRSAVREFILWDEMAYARVARPPLGAGIVAKTLIAHGTEAQKQKWLPPIRAGEKFFSLGYSEPGAGSDLAGLSTRADLHGDHYVVTGEKCWTSYAQDSDYLWTLVRTGAVEDRGRGLSLMILDLHAPGVSVRPLPTIDGEQLNQVVLDAVEVPVEHRIGPENAAWRLVKDALDVERHVQFPPARLRRDLEELVAWLRKHEHELDPVVQRTVAALGVGVFEVEALALLVLESVVKGRPGDVEAAQNKLAHAELSQKIARAPFELGLSEALIYGPIEFLYRQSTWETIGGGTSEIMRSVVARQGLGLGGRS